jgi:hypothetical protein
MRVKICPYDQGHCQTLGPQEMNRKKVLENTTRTHTQTQTII